MIPTPGLYLGRVRFRPPTGPAVSRALAAALILAAAGCNSDGITDDRAGLEPAAGAAAAVAPIVVLAAGDIADCDSPGDEATAKVLDGQPNGTVLLLGDNAYEDGTAQEYAECYGPNWGRHKARTRPSPGNHEYHTSGASGYYGYFGAAAGPSGRGYYSFDLGDWHFISLNSNVSMSAGSVQEKWLRADLAASTKKCTLAYWHHPRFSSSKHGNSSSTEPLWKALYDAGADLVLVGHDHSYERFAPQTPSGGLDRTRGVREFVVGTGGRKFYALDSRQPNSEVFESGTWGVLKLTLGSDGYAWQFLPVAGKSFTDTGNANCVGATGSPPPTNPPPTNPPPTNPPPTNPPPGGPTIPAPPGENAARVTLSYSSLTLGPPGATATVTARAFGSDNKEWSGVPIRWWQSATTSFTLGSAECASPCNVSLTTSSTGSGKVIVRHYGGVARDTMPVTVTSSNSPAPDPGPGTPPPTEPPPTNPPPPPPTTVGTCFDSRSPTITLTGGQAAYSKSSSVAANAFIDARAATWQAPAGAGAAVKAGEGSAICWHGGTINGTGSPTSTSWATYHDTYAFSMYGPTGIVENAFAANVGDGVKWFEKADNWTVRRVHLRDMHDDCVETDWMKGGRIQDVLFEGCYVFLATRPRSSASGSGAGNTVTVDGAVAWMKPTASVYSGPAPSTGAVFKVDNSSSSRSPKMVLRNIVLRVDLKPGVGNACLNPYNLVKESVNNTVVWLGSGDYPCLPLPSGWTLTRDKGVYDRAVASWKVRNPGL